MRDGGEQKYSEIVGPLCTRYMLENRVAIRENKISEKAKDKI